ncbi:MAG TPA: butyrate kinase [Rhizomicrobium sp.]|nr:butyrate kinase [Rhizomicrobium sp.]
MEPREHTILAINPGSTSTKFAVFAGERPLRAWNLKHGEEEMRPFKDRPIFEQKAFRAQAIEHELAAAGLPIAKMNAVVGRGGLLPPMESGTWRVNGAMLEEARLARRGDHASNLGAPLAYEFARRAGVEAFVVDPVSVNERSARARLSGVALLERGGFCHALNSKAVAKRYARERSTPYAHLRLIVAHLGGGNCISAHEDGRMIDATDAQQEGPFSSERAGAVPALKLVRLCFSGAYDQRQVERMLIGEGGVFSHLGTTDLVEVERRIAQGDEKAALVFDAMAYQIAKEIGAMAAVLEGSVDAILLTGGMAHSNALVGKIRKATEWIAPVTVYPGEEELLALAEGALRVLRGEETAKELCEPKS